MSSATPPPDTNVPTPAESTPVVPQVPAEKVKQFPTSPGVYLMKDVQGRVLYVGKAKNLRNRAAHYFLKAAAVATKDFGTTPFSRGSQNRGSQNRG